jgi:hypothetical protein
MTAPVSAPHVASVDTALTWFRDEAIPSSDRVLYVDGDGQEHVTISLPALKALVHAIERPVLTLGNAARAYQAEAAMPAELDRLRIVNGHFIDEEGNPLYEASMAREEGLIGHAMYGRRTEVLRRLDAAKAGGFTFVAIDASSVSSTGTRRQTSWWPRPPSAGCASR